MGLGVDRAIPLFFELQACVVFKYVYVQLLYILYDTLL